MRYGGMAEATAQTRRDSSQQLELLLDMAEMHPNMRKKISCQHEEKNGIDVGRKLRLQPTAAVISFRREALSAKSPTAMSCDGNNTFVACEKNRYDMLHATKQFIV